VALKHRIEECRLVVKERRDSTERRPDETCDTSQRHRLNATLETL
jgi:hypothetical protein